MANIFLSYAGEDFATAQQLYFALANLEHNVFFDKKTLSPGDEYNFKIIDAIRGSDFAVLLLSPDFFADNSYCRTELKIIQSNWPVPKGKIFPVIVRGVPFDILPDYIKSVTIMTPQGNLVAETVQVIQDHLLGFRADDSVSRKIRKLEIEKQLDVLDQEWAQKKKTYLIKVNDIEVHPSNELAIRVLLMCLLFAAFGFFFFTMPDLAFFGVWPTLIPFIAGGAAFLIVRAKASRFSIAEKHYFKRRASIAQELPSDGVDLLKMYK